MNKQLKPGLSDLRASVHIEWRTRLGGGGSEGIHNCEGIGCFMEIKRLLRDVEEQICERARPEENK